MRGNNPFDTPKSTSNPFDDWSRGAPSNPFATFNELAATSAPKSSRPNPINRQNPDSIFTVEERNLNFKIPASIRRLALQNNNLVMALENGHIIRLNLDEDKELEGMSLKNLIS